jgi:hypothetical protein
MSAHLALVLVHDTVEDRFECPAGAARRRCVENSNDTIACMVQLPESKLALVLVLVYVKGLLAVCFRCAAGGSGLGVALLQGKRPVRKLRMIKGIPGNTKSKGGKLQTAKCNSLL